MNEIIVKALKDLLMEHCQQRHMMSCECGDGTAEFLATRGVLPPLPTPKSQRWP